MPRALAARVLVVFAASRVACLIGLARSGGARGGGLAVTVRSFDGFWYRLIVEHGYPQVLDVDRNGLFKRSTIAFFPGFPAAVRPVTAAGAPFWAAGLAVNLVAGTAAALLIAGLARRHTGNDRAALLAAALWSVLPSSYVLCMTYSEALFCALAAGCLLALATDRWLVAGLLAALAGATRPTGVAVMLACGVGAIAGAVRGRGVRGRLGPFLAPLLAPLGALAYVAFLRRRFGRAQVWSQVERDGWHTRPDFGAAAYRRITLALSGGGPTLTSVYVAVVVLAALVLLVLAVVDRLPAAQLVYSAAVVALALSSGGGVFSSLPRMLLPAFPLLIPLARWLARVPWPATVALVAGALPVLSYAAVALLANPGFAP